MAISVSSQSDMDRRPVERERLQFGVIVMMLVMSVAWLVVYTTVVDGGVRFRSVSPEMAGKLAQQHAIELRQLQFQMTEIYGGTPPPPAGS